MRMNFTQWVRCRLGRQQSSSRIRSRASVGLAICLFVVAARPAAAQEQLLFPANDNAAAEILRLIRAETTSGGIDVALWLLGETEISQALVLKHQQGVRVRVIGDRGSIFEGDQNTRNQFEYLARNGVPIVLRYHPTWELQIIHWKAGIFAGQNVVEFGSANWTAFELKPWPGTFKDETALFTDDSTIVNAFKTKFDEYWTDTTYFVDWPTAYRLETGTTWPYPMTVVRQAAYPVSSTNIPGMVWSQGTELNNAMIAEIDREPAGGTIDVVSYRQTVNNVTDRLIAAHNRGVQVRFIMEQTQYRNAGFPEYELVGAMMDKLWIAGIPIKKRLHEGLTHMKTLLTSRVGLVASSNFTKFWQRDHNYFISATGKPNLYSDYRQRFNEMWNSSANHGPFYPLPPNAAGLLTPASGQTNVSTQPRLEWKRAPFATSFDVFLGTSQSNMAFVGRINAKVDEFPPDTYSFTPSQPLQPSTTYFWKVVSRTYATPADPSLVASSATRWFTTSSSGGTGPGPFTGTPAPLPGVVQAENFDTGGQNVAYFDTTAGNSGGVYRSTDVDLAGSEDAGGGYVVGWIKPGEWLKYTVNVAAAGNYRLEFRVASSGVGGTFHLEVNGVNKTGPITIPNTGGHQAWTTIGKDDVPLSAGQQIFTLVMDNLNGGGFGNLNYFRVVADGGGGGSSTPYGGSPAALPGVIEAEKFDEGGAGVAYVDTTPGNSGGVFRSTDVDIATTSDAGGGYTLGWVKPGEWLNYTVSVAAAGTYDIEVRVASASTGGTFHIEVNGANKTGSLTVPNTGDWQAWTTVRRTGVSLSAGTQVWRLVMDTNGATSVGNFNYIRVIASGGSTTAAFGGIPAALPGIVQAEDFDTGGEGVSYHDLSPLNEGGAYRSTGVDIAVAADSGGGHTLGWVSAGEWLEYTVAVSAAGTYTFDVRVASAGVGGTFHIEVDGVNKTGTMAVPDTGGWQNWVTISKPGVSLSAGEQVLRLVMNSNGPTTDAVGNFNWVNVTPGA